MSSGVFRPLPTGLAVFLASVAAAVAAGPISLLHSFFDPGTNTPQWAPQFGSSLAINGNAVVVGIPRHDMTASRDDAGLVKVFDFGSATLSHTLTNPLATFDDQYGYAVAISGTRVLVGSPNDDLGAANAGVAFVYDLSGPMPTVPFFTLTNPSPAASDFFGLAVAVSADWIAVGTQYDDTGAENAGVTCIYNLGALNPAAPVLVLTNPIPQRNGRFGRAVALDGSRLAIGVGDVTGAYSAAYVYDLSGASPSVPVTSLTRPSSAVNFGFAVSISGSRIAIGAPHNVGISGYGTAFVYDLDAPTPDVPVLALTNPAPMVADYFGYSVSISSNRVVVGVPQADFGATNSGIAYLYHLAGSTPGLSVLTLTNPAPAPGDAFGFAVAVSAAGLIAGAPSDDGPTTDSGTVCFYELDGATPDVPAAQADHSPPIAGTSQFANAMALSTPFLAVAAPVHDRGAPDSGCVHVYDLRIHMPVGPMLVLTNPSPWTNDQFGAAIAMSGSRLAVGAPLDDTGLFDAGVTYVYDLSSGTPATTALTLTNPAPVFGGGFGSPLAMSGSRLLAGARSRVNPSPERVIHVYDVGGPMPSRPVLTLTNPFPNGLFGASVAIDGNIVVIGVPGAGDVINGTGRAYLIDLASPTPTMPIVTVTNSSPDHLAGLGTAVAISGNRLAIGVPQAFNFFPMTGYGRIQIHDLSSPQPAIPVLKLINPTNDTFIREFGKFLALDGSRLVVGIPGQFYAVPGHALVYDLNTSPTKPTATISNPTPATGDSFGQSVAIDGINVAIAAPGDDTAGLNFGAAYLYTVGPALKLSPVASGLVQLSWAPTNSPGWVLQYSDSIFPAQWVNAPSGAANPVTLPAGGTNRYYRVALP